MMTSGSGCDILVLLGINTLGGAELSVLAIARGLKRSGLDVQLVVYGQKRSIVKIMAPEMSVLEIDADRNLGALKPLIMILSEKQPHVMISGLRFPNILGLLAKRFSLAKVRTIITEHSPISAQVKGYKQVLARILMDILYPDASAVVAVSQGIADGFGNLAPPKKRHVIYNPVVKKSDVPLPAAHPWLNPGEPPVVMSIGRLSVEKNFKLLMLAFARATAVTTARLIILGEGAERKMLEALAAKLGITDRVLLPGFVSDVAAWLPYAKVFVCSSQYEGFGNAIVEAMHYRVPVIATDCRVGPREILDNGRFGYLVPNEDKEALANAISAGLTSPADTQPAFDRAQLYSEERCFDAYKSLIQQIAPT